MFADANELGKVSSSLGAALGAVPLAGEYTLAGVYALAEILVQYAADAAATAGANGGGDGNANSNGAFADSTRSMLSVDINPSDYKQTFSKGSETIVGVNDLGDAALYNVLPVPPTSTVGNGAHADDAVMNFLNINKMAAIDISLESITIGTNTFNSNSFVVWESGSGTLNFGGLSQSFFPVYGLVM